MFHKLGSIIPDLKQGMQLTHDRRRAAAQFEQLWGVEGIEDLLDTDYASSILSCDEDALSDDSKEWHKDADVGQGANMARGKKWRTKKVCTHLGLFEPVIWLANATHT
jgi:hypothetical protein